jgi:hypothetical protein
MKDEQHFAANSSGIRCEMQRNDFDRNFPPIVEPSFIAPWRACAKSRERTGGGRRT